MAVTPPAGWSQRTNPNEYEAILIQGQYKYEVNVNVQTGQRQIYTIDPIFRTREFVGTINANGSTQRQEAWSNIASLPNGQTRLKEIIDASRTAANKIVGSVGTEEQKRRLAEQKEFSKLKAGMGAPTAPGAQGGTQPDGSGTDPGANNPDTGINATTQAGIDTLENVLDKFGDKNSFKNKYYYYPETIGNSAQDRIVISQIEYVPGNVRGALEGSLSQRESQFTQQRLLGSVTLPIPNELSETNTTGWGEDSLSSITAALMGNVTGVVGNLTDGNFSATLDDFKSTLGTLSNPAAKQRLEQFLTVNAAASVLKFGGILVNPEAYITRTTGSAINPNLELLFQGPKLRQFGFSFKMSPRSAKEASQIRGIIKFFKKGMAPRRSTEANLSVFLGTPNVFRINFKSGGNDLRSVGKIKTCALVSCTVNYTPDGFYAAYEDAAAGGSQPVSVNIQLGFTELTPIFNDEYDGDTDEVGPENIFKDFNVKPSNPQSPPPSANPGPSRGGTSGAASPTRPFQPGGSTAVPGVDFDPNRPGNAPVLGPGGVRGV